MGDDSVDLAVEAARWRSGRSRALHLLVAEKLRADPGLLDRARATLARWRATPSHADRYFAEWASILDRGLEATLAALAEETDHADDLRKCSPFAGVPSDEERRAILAEWAPRQPWPRS